MNTINQSLLILMIIAVGGYSTQQMDPIGETDDAQNVEQQQSPNDEPVASTVTDAAADDEGTDDEKRAKAKKLVDEVNAKNKGKGWKAAYNEKFALMDDKVKKQLGGGVRGVEPPTPLPLAESNAQRQNGTDQAEPVEAQDDNTDKEGMRRRKRQVSCSNTVGFDARTQWPGCKAIINKVQDQSGCGSCWAVSTASAFTDRYCIQRAKLGLTTNAAAATSHFSAKDVLSCSPGSYGCDGGYPSYAWNWIKSYGVVTGTDYTWNSGCKPYPFPPNSANTYIAPSCTSSCANTAWPRGYALDKKFAKWTKSISGAGLITAIQNEIRVNGSVVATMDVYDDFYYYSSGVYKHVSTNYVGGHAIRLIGWGIRTCTDGTRQPYWMAVNSWNTNWGIGGFFQIARGTDECRIESSGIYYGTPKL